MQIASMGRPRILDVKIMKKIAKKIGKRDLTVVNKRVSAKASKLGISPEVALILIAREHGIGTSVYQRKLDSTKQNEVRGALPAIFTSVARVGGGVRPHTSTRTRRISSSRTALRSV